MHWDHKGSIPFANQSIMYGGQCPILRTPEFMPVHRIYDPLEGNVKGTGKSVPLQAWSDPEGSRKLRFPDYVTMTQDGGKVVSVMHRPLLTPRKYSWYSFLLEAESTPGP